MVLEIDQVRKLKQLAEENQRLKRLVADLTLDKTMLPARLAHEFQRPRNVAGNTRKIHLLGKTGSTFRNRQILV